VARRKGISPVIATVIIVAVTIAVAIAVAFWMTGIVGLFTGAEKLEIVSINAAPAAGDGGNRWTITITVRNTGTTTTSIDAIYINGYLAFTTAAGANALNCVANLNPVLPVRLAPGDQANIAFDIIQGDCNLGGNRVFSATPGGSIEVKLHSTGGKEYPKLVVLP
jgi:flagellin-like protein